jgi:cytochrome c oxidase cbb3-type subunit 4
MNLDITDFRSIATVLCFVAFLGVTWWAYAPGRRRQFDEAARLPFADGSANESDPKENTHHE